MTDRHPEIELATYAAGGLPARERAEVERHLAGCAACHATVADYRLLLARLTATPPPAPDVAWPRYRAELRARLERLAPASWRARWLRPVPVAASMATVAACAILIYTLGPAAVPPTDLTAIEYDGLAGRMELIDHYHVVEQLDLLEDLDVIRNLDTLTPTREG